MPVASVSPFQRTLRPLERIARSQVEVSALKHPSPLSLPGSVALLRLQSDERLVALVRRGHHSAFEALVARYQPRLLAFCRHMLSSREDAEDVLQEVFAAAFNAMLADNRAINVRPWLYRIARNRSLNHLRRATAVGVDSMDVHFADAGQSTGEKVFKRETFRLLMDDVRALPESQRTALLLREMEALSYQEIAEAMETTVPSVKSLLVRARVSLAEATEARRLSCDEVRLELGQVAEGLVRISPPVRRHVRECERCTGFRSALRANNRALAAVMPLGPLVLIKKLALAKMGTTAGAGSAAGAGGATAAAGTTAVGTAGGGAAGLISAGAGALATKAVAGLAAAALVTAGAVEVRHATVTQRHRSAPHQVQARVPAVTHVLPSGPVVNEAFAPGRGHASVARAHRRARLARARRAAHRAAVLRAQAPKQTATPKTPTAPKPPTKQVAAKQPFTQQVSGTTALPVAPSSTAGGPPPPASTGPGAQGYPASSPPPADNSGSSDSGSGSNGSGSTGQPSSSGSSGSGSGSETGSGGPGSSGQGSGSGSGGGGALPGGSPPGGSTPPPPSGTSGTPPASP